MKYPGLPLDIRDTRAEAKERQDAERLLAGKSRCTLRVSVVEDE